MVHPDVVLMAARSSPLKASAELPRAIPDPGAVEGSHSFAEGDQLAVRQSVGGEGGRQGY